VLYCGRASELEAAVGTIDELLAHADRYATTFRYAGLPAPPHRKVAIVTCMDARIDPAQILGLHPGEAHVIRNAGGALTPDVRRSLVISQRLLGTRTVAVIRHTGCGLLNLDGGALIEQLTGEVGHRPDWEVHAFTDLTADLAADLDDLRADPFLPHRADIRGFVYDARVTGRLTEIPAPAARAA
jgi:carbonic anhydrase